MAEDKVLVTYDGKAFHRIKYQPKLDNQNFPTGHYIQTNSEQTTIHGTYLDDIKNKVDQNGENELQIAVKKIIGWGIHAILTDKKGQYYLLTNSVQHLPPADHQFGSFYEALLAILLKLGYVNDKVRYDDEENPTEITFTITPRNGLDQPYSMYFYSPDTSCYFISQGS